MRRLTQICATVDKKIHDLIAGRCVVLYSHAPAECQICAEFLVSDGDATLAALPYSDYPVTPAAPRSSAGIGPRLRNVRPACQQAEMGQTVVRQDQRRRYLLSASGRLSGFTAQGFRYKLMVRVSWKLFVASDHCHQSRLDAPAGRLPSGWRVSARFVDPPSTQLSALLTVLTASVRL